MTDHYAKARDESRARYPLDGDGNRACTEHGITLGTGDWECSACTEQRKSQREREHALQQCRDRVRTWWQHSCEPVEGLGGLPQWAWARFDNAAWLARCDRRLLAAVHAWDLRKSLALFGKTGSGKSSLVVAALEQAHVQTLTLAERGPFQLPPRFVYLTGFELSEAAKSRRLGQEEHALVRAAQKRELAILDEVHPSHTPADVLFAILDMRYRRGLATVIASGMSAEEFGAAFGAHTYRRATEGRKAVDLFAKGTK
jgi:DNA replication protein DnaC